MSAPTRQPVALLALTSVPDAATAESIAACLVSERLAACVNILPGVRSVYRWRGAIESATELMLAIKTTQARYPALEEAIRRLHPYDLPEVIALDIHAGLPAYLRWIAEETLSTLHA